MQGFLQDWSLQMPNVDGDMSWIPLTSGSNTSCQLFIYLLGSSKANYKVTTSKKVNITNTNITTKENKM
jgi:hypothetical protein